MFYRILRGIVRAVLSIPFRIKIESAERLPEEGGLIVASNHRRAIDPVFLSVAYPKPICYMAKKELFVPILGGFLRLLGAFPVDRGKGDTHALDEAKELLNKGRNLGIFPEGTRSKDGTFGRVKSGTVVIASRTGADILPMAILYGEKKPFRRQSVTVRIGERIRNAEMQLDVTQKSTLKAANRLLASRISGLLGEEVCP